MEKKFLTKKRISKLPVVLIDTSVIINSCIKGITDKAREFGWRMVDLNITNGVLPDGCNIIGAIIGKPIGHQDIKISADFNFPLVRVGYKHHPSDQDIPAVIIDYKAIGKMAAEHFIMRNFKNVAYIGNIPWHGGKELFESFKKTAENNDCKCHLLRFPDPPFISPEKRYKMQLAKFKDWVPEIPKPIGIFTYHDNSASKIITMSQAAGLNVPLDIAVLGCGNDKKKCECSLVPISSIDCGYTKQGGEALEILKSVINRNTSLKSPLVIPPVGVEERMSTDVLAVSNPLVARVTHFIWDNLEMQISIDEIAGKFGASRSILDHAFKRSLGRTVSAERQRKRLETCAEAIRGTNLTIPEIAQKLGFNSLSYFYRSFKKEFGFTPSQYRLNKNKS